MANLKFSEKQDLKKSLLIIKDLQIHGANKHYASLLFG